MISLNFSPAVPIKKTEANKTIRKFPRLSTGGGSCDKGENSMDMMTDIAAMAMDMKAAQFQQNYSLSVAKKAMDSGEEMAETLINDMMPQIPQIPKGEYIDVYA